MSIISEISYKISLYSYLLQICRNSSVKKRPIRRSGYVFLSLHNKLHCKKPFLVKELV